MLKRVGIVCGYIADSKNIKKKIEICLGNRPMSLVLEVLLIFPFRKGSRRKKRSTFNLKILVFSKNLIYLQVQKTINNIKIFK